MDGKGIDKTFIVNLHFTSGYMSKHERKTGKWGWCQQADKYTVSTLLLCDFTRLYWKTAISLCFDFVFLSLLIGVYVLYLLPCDFLPCSSGLIGRSWAMLFVSGGYNVKIYDNQPGQSAKAIAEIKWVLLLNLKTHLGYTDKLPQS